MSPRPRPFAALAARSVVAVLACVCLPPGVPAQGLAPPVQLAQTVQLPGFGAGALPGTDARHVHVVHLPGDPPNVVYAAVTVANLPAAWGGVVGPAGAGDFVCGRYDVLADTFVPNTDATRLNSAGNEQGMMLHPTGTFAVFDRWNGWPWLASRTATNQPWQVVGPIGPLVPQAGYWPALATLRGRPQLLFVRQDEIVLQPIDLVTAQLFGSPTVVARAGRGGATVLGPVPVTDPGGELLGVSYHDVFATFGATSGVHWLAADLDPDTPPVALTTTNTFPGAGGFVGGRFFDAQLVPAVGRTGSASIGAVDAIWFAGGRAAVGTTMTVACFAPPSTWQPFVSVLFVARDFTAPVAVPGMLGVLGLDPATAVTDGTFGLHTLADGTLLRTFAVPNVAALRGTRLPAQCVTLDLANATTNLGNTAALVVD